jgi:hypothetical protein
MLLPRLVLSEYSTQIVDMRVKEATTNDRSLTSASQRRGRFITGRSSLCLHLVRPSSDRPLAPNTWAAEILDGEMQLGPSGTQQTFWRGRLVLNNGGATWRQVDAAARGEKAVNLTPPIEKGGRPPGGDGGSSLRSPRNTTPFMVLLRCAVIDQCFAPSRSTRPAAEAPQSCGPPRRASQRTSRPPHPGSRRPRSDGSPRG